jgi:hypothetical protein
MPFVRENILHRLMTSIIDRRLSELLKKTGDCPEDALGASRGCDAMLTVGVSVREFVRGLICVGITATIRSPRSVVIPTAELVSSADTLGLSSIDQLTSSFEAICVETRRLRESGVLERELEAAKKKWLHMYIDQRDYQSKTTSAVMADLSSHILSGGVQPFLSLTHEADLCIRQIESINTTDMNEFISRILDIDLEKSQSNYYASHQTGNESARFRVISTQLPASCTRTSSPAEGGIGVDPATSILRDIVETTRKKVSSLPPLQQWSNDTKAAQEKDIVEAARCVLNHLKESPDFSDQERLTASTQFTPASFNCLCCNRKSQQCKFYTPPSSLMMMNECQKILSPPIPLLPTPSVPVSVSPIDDIGAFEIQLPNGITVCLKQMEKGSDSPGRVSFQGFALGGSSELSETEDFTMNMLDSIAGNSPFSLRNIGIPADAVSNLEISGRYVADVQSITKTRVNTQRHYHHRGIGGSSPTDKFELLLSFLVLKLTCQQIDRDGFDDCISRQRGAIEFRDNSPENALMERALVLSSGDIPIYRPITEEVIQNSTLEMARSLYARAFLADPTEFTFVFIGDLPPLDNVVSLIEMYLGSLKPLSMDKIEALGGRWRDRKESLNSQHMLQQSTETAPDNYDFHPFTRLGLEYSVDQPIIETISLRQANTASSIIVFRVDLRHQDTSESEERDILFKLSLDAACRVLQTVLLDSLRIDLGKVYSVSVDFCAGSMSPVAVISIGFHCDPDDLSQVQRVVDQRISDIAREGPPASLVSGVVEALHAKRNLSIKSPSYWLFWILDSYKALRVCEWKALKSNSKITNTHACLSRFIKLRSSDHDAIREATSPERLVQVYRDYFNTNRCVRVTLYPEEPVPVHIDVRVE